MKIAILGGTGKLGQGLALQWSENHHILIGSRDPAKAKTLAASYLKLAKQFYGKKFGGSIKGAENVNAAVQSDLIVLSIPFEGLNDLLIALKQRISEDQVIICPIVPMLKTETGFQHRPYTFVDSSGRRLQSRSVAEVVADELSPRERVVAGLHTLSSKKLAELGKPLNCDALFCGDDKSKVSFAAKVAEEIKGVRVVYAGPLSNSSQLEAAAVMIQNVAKFSGVREPLIKIL